jgi:hypothetical protein
MQANSRSVNMYHKSSDYYHLIIQLCRDKESLGEEHARSKNALGAEFYNLVQCHLFGLFSLKCTLRLMR